MMGLSVTRQINEKAFQTIVIATARECGWMVYHTYDSRKSEPGFPDLCMVKDGIVMFVELKTDKGKATTAQRNWIKQFIRHQHRCQRFIVEIWRPKTWEEKKKLLTEGIAICPHESISVTRENAVCDDCGHAMKA